MLRLENITKDYVVGKNITHALKGIDIEFRSGEFVAILGPSGCGKTTLLNIVGGLDRYTSGDMYVNGRSTKEYEDYDWDRYRNKTIGFIFQNYNLIMHQTILSNVELALTLIGVGRAERKRRAMEALESVGLADQYYKKPNQLSGGQMQRVAIARAIVNNPGILLADEPTGALDSESSVQVMDILKDLSKDRLVIMVTHNDDLAQQYADRIVRIKDGVVTSDSNPYDSGVAPKPARAKEKNIFKRMKNFLMHGKQEKHTSMSYESAIRLSANNLSTKKMRTALTSFAGSIGIIGIAIVLSLSSGFSSYIGNMEKNALSSYPVVIGSDSGMNLDQAISTILSSNQNADDLRELFPDVSEMYIQNVTALAFINSMLTTSAEDLADFKEYFEENWQSDWGYYRYNYDIGMTIWSNFASPDDGTYTRIYPFDDLIPTNLQQFSSFAAGLEAFQEMPEPESFYQQYDLIYGSRPASANEAVLIVDSRNQINDMMVMAIGLVEVDANTNIGTLMNIFMNDELTYDFDRLCWTGEGDDSYLEYNITTNGDQYVPTDLGDSYEQMTASQFTQKGSNVDDSMKLKVVGVVRVKEGVENPCMSGVIGYLPEFTQNMINHNNATDVVQAQLASTDRSVIYSETGNNVWTDEKTREENYKNALAALGYAQIDKPSTINVYAISTSGKEAILGMIAAYNDISDKEDVPYTDMLGDMMGFINSLSDTVTYVLVGFSAISLIVSCIMIGIITYISVMERTKEIGILRSIGARKRDIARVFNAETFMIGLLSGIIGVVFTCIIYFPANAILNAVLGIGSLFQLVWWQLVGLVIISVVLTLISGFIPAHMAAKKDPVIALRSE